MTLLRPFLVFCRMVKIEHSVFALPFAYLGAFIAASGWPGWRVFILLTLAMVAVRSFAMAFNRLADLRYDRENPRTQNRPLVTGEITPPQTLQLLAITAGVFVLACLGLNRWCLLLALPTLALCAAYSYAKRFTWLSHFALGLCLGLAPVAGWVAVQPAASLPQLLFLLGVLFWVAGFDILYACQDVEFDLAHGLRSIPARFGLPTALALAVFCHVNASLFFLLAGWSAWLAWPYFLVWAGVSAVLLWEHRLVRPDDLSRVNLAFFTLNGFVSVALFGGVAWSVLAG